MLGLLAIIVGLGWWGWAKTHPAENPASSLLTDTVKRGDLIETVSTTGSVTAQTGALVKIGSQITGRIKRLYADVGSQVKAGQVIAELDLPDIEAQLQQAQANLAAARTRLAQQQAGVEMQHTQTNGAVLQAEADLRGAQARLASAEAAARLQTAQTPTDIKRAETALRVAQAALSTARSNLKQVQASAKLQVATAQEGLTQAQATAENSARNLKRQQELFKKGFVAASIVDAAEATNTVNQSQVNTARQNVQLVKDKVAADLQSAQDQVTQAQQNVDAAHAALAAAQAGTYQDAARLADVNNARAQVRQAQANLKIAQGNTAQNTLKQQDVLQAQEAVRQAQAQVDYAKAQVAKTFIRSPISGTVLQLASQQGETLAAGLSAPTLIIVADLTRLQVDAFIDETDIGKIRIGQRADITVDAFPKKVFKGRVTKIASGSTIQQGVITYDVAIALEDPDHQLKPDMTASVTIQTGKRENVLLVPSEAVKVGKRGTTVNVLTMKDGKPEPQPRPVKTGSSDGVNTEILDGLKEGETIVLAGGDEGRGNRRNASPFGPSNNKKGGKGGGKKG
jgi:RND family efflux transporter MFP subunit